jgi:hypothetical protein
MQTVTKPSSVPPTAAKLEGETLSYETPENKNIPKVTTFRNDKAGDQPGVQGLSDLEHYVSWCQNPFTPPVQEAKVHALRQEMDRHNELLCHSWDEIRREAHDLLIMMIRFDTKVGMEDSRILCDAVNVINKAASS